MHGRVYAGEPAHRLAPKRPLSCCRPILTSRHFTDCCQTSALRAASARLGGNGKKAATGSNEPKLPAAVQATSEVLQVFGGRTRSEIVCSCCHHRSACYESFLDLSLELKRAASVTSALEQFTSTEKVSAPNHRRTALPLRHHSVSHHSATLHPSLLATSSSARGR